MCYVHSSMLMGNPELTLAINLELYIGTEQNKIQELHTLDDLHLNQLRD